MTQRPVAVLGGGAWGTALSVLLAGRGHAVRLFLRNPDHVARMREHRDNPVHLPGVTVPETILPVSDVAAAVEGARLVLVAVPTAFARAAHERLLPHLPSDAVLALATKGIEEGTLALPSEVARQVLGEGRRVAVLSGPSFAPEVARGRPTAVVAASEDRELASSLQELFAGSPLRVYTNEDPRGVQIAGALKNVIAIAAGVADGLGMGSGAVASLITRGLGEMRRLGASCGARTETFSGLAGLGDLVLTCTGDLSRNRRVGQALGRGELLRDVLAHTSSVVEGVGTARAACALARRAGVSLPIVEEVDRLLQGEISPQEGVARLLARPLTSEEGEPKGRPA